MKMHEGGSTRPDVVLPESGTTSGAGAPSGTTATHTGAAQTQTRSGRFAFDSVQVFGGQIAMMAIGVVNGVIMARWLGASGRGTLQILLLMPLVLSNFVKLGIPQASVYFMRRRGASAADVASNSIWIACVSGGLAVVVCWWYRDWLLARFLKEAPPELLFPSLLLMPFMLLQFYLLGVAQAQQRFREYNIRQVVPNVLSLIGLVVTLIVLHKGVAGAIWVQFVIQVFMTIWMVVRVHREVGLHLRWTGSLARGMLAFGRKSYVQTLAATLHLRIDQFMCAYFLTPADVGLYAVAVSLGSMLDKIADAVGTVMFPRLAGLRERDAHAATTRVCRHTLFILAIGAAGLAVMLNVALNWYMIPRYGILGAATANGLSYGTAALVLLVAFIRESGFSVVETLVPRAGEITDMVHTARGMVAKLSGRRAA